MQWTKPEYQEISLGMEVTAYVNTDDKGRKPEEVPQRNEASTPAGANPAPREVPA